MLPTDPSCIDLSLDSRAVTFENPTGERGAGGTAHGGRKGAPSRMFEPGERVVLADIAGPGTVRHIWVTVPPARPEILRAWLLDVFYDGLAEPSISVPLLDFFGLANGRAVPYASALTSAQEGRGFNAYFPMPFRRRIRFELTNGSTRTLPCYFQVDYTLERELPADAGYLHASFRRENPTRMREDFTIVEGLRGPGRFLGCIVGIRVLDEGVWYGEGEVKVFRDGDTTNPTICGTGLEDYVGTAWGMGQHHAPYAGAPASIGPEGAAQPDWVSFYRWHLPDPIVFATDLRVTIQQIGYALFPEGQEDAFARYSETHPAAGAGWDRNVRPGAHAQGIAERVDDYCATAFVYCREPQPVPRVELEGAIADLARKEYEQPARALPFG
ncbi:MAG: glycoside hydrolase family 172 protein [Dehalococcoidia bacterium]